MKTQSIPTRYGGRGAFAEHNTGKVKYKEGEDGWMKAEEESWEEGKITTWRGGNKEKKDDKGKWKEKRWEERQRDWNKVISCRGGKGKKVRIQNGKVGENEWSIWPYIYRYIDIFKERDRKKDGEWDCLGERSVSLNRRHLEKAHWLWSWLAGPSYLVSHLFLMYAEIKPSSFSSSSFISPSEMTGPTRPATFLWRGGQTYNYSLQLSVSISPEISTGASKWTTQSTL